jgi:type II secretory pathway component GspD/PulD (secretin)
MLEISIAAAIWTGSTAWGQAASRPAAAPATAPAAARPATQTSAEQSAKLYNDAPLEAVINDLARKFHIVVIMHGPLNGRITTRIPDDLNPAGAAALVESLLAGHGYSLAESGDRPIVWQIAPMTPETRAIAAARAQERARQAALPPAGADLPSGAPTMKFQFVETPVETILDEISARLGIEIDRAEPVPGRISIIVPQPVDADEALRLLNSILAPAQYTAVRLHRLNADGTPRLAVRIGTIRDGRKGSIPVE